MKLREYFSQWFFRYKNRNRCIFTGNILIDKNVELEGGNKLCIHSTILNVKLGYGSYIGDSSFVKNTKIGRYCCIARDVRTVIGNHPSENFVSVHPAFYSVRKQSGFTYVSKQKFEDFKYLDRENKISIIIGNDVWIGEGARILEGVTIGDGAIIASGSIVTKDVDSYTVVGGVPAKKIRDRFDSNVILFLEKWKWWNLPSFEIQKLVDDFDNVNKIIEKIDKQS